MGTPNRGRSDRQARHPSAKSAVASTMIASYESRARMRQASLMSSAQVRRKPNSPRCVISGTHHADS